MWFIHLELVVLTLIIVNIVKNKSNILWMKLKNYYIIGDMLKKVIIKLHFLIIKEKHHRTVEKSLKDLRNATKRQCNGFYLIILI